MAAVPKTFEFTIPVSGTATMASVTGWPEKTWMSSLAMRADRDNTNDIYWADEDSERGGYIGPGEAVSFNFEGQALIRDVNLVGSSGDVVYLTIGLNSEGYDYDA